MIFLKYRLMLFCHKASKNLPRSIQTDDILYRLPIFKFYRVALIVMKT